MKSMREIFRSYAVLDAEGRHTNGTDKQSNHNYGDAYEELFFSYEYREVRVTDLGTEMLSHRISKRDLVKLMMEVGVADGSCLLAWRDIFPNALCVGMDIHPADRLIGRMGRGVDRIEFHSGNQQAQVDCERTVNGRKFDFIVEDATHRLEDTLQTLLYLWPSVKPGGLYVVEEFANIGQLWPNVVQLWPNAELIETIGPFGGIEPLVVFRKPL